MHVIVVKFQDNVFIYFYYFISGYICEEHDNPADFLLDVINQCEGQTSATAGKTAVYPQYLTYYCNTCTYFSLSLFLKDLLAIESDVTPIDLSENYLKSRQCLDTKSECERILGGLEKDGVGNKRRRTRGKYATNFFWQVREREKRWIEIFILYCYYCLNFTCIFSSYFSYLW